MRARIGSRRVHGVLVQRYSAVSERATQRRSGVRMEPRFEASTVMVAWRVHRAELDRSEGLFLSCLQRVGTIEDKDGDGVVGRTRREIWLIWSPRDLRWCWLGPSTRARIDSVSLQRSANYTSN